jgi:hypothetical protein
MIIILILLSQFFCCHSYDTDAKEEETAVTASAGERSWVPTIASGVIV